jgi:hypothetical protein
MPLPAPGMDRFAASLDGAFLESQQKMVELELADE